MENAKPHDQRGKDQKSQPQANTNKQTENDLTKKDIPDSTNESTGVPGSGQRQDSN